jgi:hypothetical protein
MSSSPRAEKTAYRLFEFFTANIRDPHARRAYSASLGLEQFAPYSFGVR